MCNVSVCAIYIYIYTDSICVYVCIYVCMYVFTVCIFPISVFSDLRVLSLIRQ